MNHRHPWQLKKIKILEAVLEQPANSTANSAYSPKKNGPNWLNWQCCLATSFKTAPTILMAMGADYSFELIFNETCAHQFNGHNNSFLASVVIISFLWKSPIIRDATKWVIVWQPRSYPWSLENILVDIPKRAKLLQTQLWSLTFGQFKTLQRLTSSDDRHCFHTYFFYDGKKLKWQKKSFCKC